MLKRLLLSVVEFIAFTLIIGGLSLAHAKSCEDDSLESVSDDGSILKTLSGQVFEVEAGDAIDTALWLPVDDVLICEIGGSTVEIINTDENDEKASAQRLKPAEAPVPRRPGRPLDFSDLIPKKESAPSPAPLPEGFSAKPPKRKIPEGFSATKPTTLAETEKNVTQNNTGTVYVKYRGAVNLAPFKCNALTRSSFMARRYFKWVS